MTAELIYPTALPSDGNNTQVKRGDLLAVSRSGKTIKAAWDGEATMPDSSTADATKRLYVKRDGRPAWFYPNGAYSFAPMNRPLSKPFPTRQNITTSGLSFADVLAFSLDIERPYATGDDWYTLPIAWNRGVRAGSRSSDPERLYIFNVPVAGVITLRIISERVFYLTTSLANPSRGAIRIWTLRGLRKGGSTAPFTA